MTQGRGRGRSSTFLDDDDDDVDDNSDKFSGAESKFDSPPNKLALPILAA